MKLLSLSTLLVLFTLVACSQQIPQSTVTEAPPNKQVAQLPDGVIQEGTSTPTETTAQSNTPQVPIGFPDASLYEWVMVNNGFNRPVDIASASDGTDNIYIVEQIGIIWNLNPGNGEKSVFIDIVDRVGSAGNEQGLLGLAFDPAFIVNGNFYVNYTDRNGNTNISRFGSISKTESRTIIGLPASEEILLHIGQPYANHNGGDLTFGPDGYLWIGLGDGGSAGDPKNNAQSLASFLGKMLRIDVRNPGGYTIPEDNRLSMEEGLQEIVFSGLRNPWRFSFDNLTGELYIGDVGQNRLEEIDHVEKYIPGKVLNFGWNIKEGTLDYKNHRVPGDLQLVDPIYEYGREQGCSITGGYVYRGKLLPEWDGIYFFGDFCSGDISGLYRDLDGQWINKELFSMDEPISSFGLDHRGELYFASLGGSIFQFSQK
jgi:glucose/arabinose dehydrogenase